MKIGVDIHGVANSQPEFFAELTYLFVNAGHEVHILTGPSLKPNSKYGERTLKEISDLNLTYTHLFSIVDYHEEIGTAIKYEDENNPWIDKQLWNNTKGIYCEKHNIDLMLDDTAVYADHFKTPFVNFVTLKNR